MLMRMQCVHGDESKRQTFEKTSFGAKAWFQIIRNGLDVIEYVSKSYKKYGQSPNISEISNELLAIAVWMRPKTLAVEWKKFGINRYISDESIISILPEMFPKIIAQHIQPDDSWKVCKVNCVCQHCANSWTNVWAGMQINIRQTDVECCEAN